MSILIYIAIVIISALWVHRDAKRFREKGVDLNPGLWSTLVFLFWIIAFPLYLILKFSKYKKTAQLGNPPLPPKSRIYNWLIVIIFIGIPFLIILFFLVSSLITAILKEPNQPAVERQKQLAGEKQEKKQMVFEYSGSVYRYDLITASSDPNSTAIAWLKVSDQRNGDMQYIFRVDQETKVYKGVGVDKIEINITDLISMKKGDNVSVRYYSSESIGQIKVGQFRVVKEIVLN